MHSAHCFYGSPLLQQWALVLDFVPGSPGLDLVSESLQFLDLSFKIVLKLVSLGGIAGAPNLLIYAFEGLYALSDLLEGLVNFLLRFSGSHDDVFITWLLGALCLKLKVVLRVRACRQRTSGTGCG